MAFKSINHDDEKIFYNRLWKLMEERKLSTARELAQALFAKGIVPVDSTSENEESIIGSMTRRIQEHLNLEDTNKLQGRYVRAYCNFFGCSSDYLFGLSSIKSGNPDVIKFCEATGLSEKSVRRLIEDLPEDIKRDLVEFWSNVLESNLFYAVPLEFHQMCYELGQYRIAQDQIKTINMAAKKMDNSDTFVETWRAMMENDYLKEAQPHEGAYYMHLNEILVNVTTYLENLVDEYVPTHKKEIQEYFYDDLNKKLQKIHDYFLKTIQSG
ncbi:MAG: hypothetical protein ACLRT4_02805 [Thomasclavelia sp.]